jgi:uncharacterized protein YprB with RNaseH-like and TPR domain
MKVSDSVDFATTIRNISKDDLVKKARQEGSNTLYTLVKNTSKSILNKMAKEVCQHSHTFWLHPACFIEKYKIEEKIGILDIEPHNLNADYGVCVCYTIKEYGKNVFYQDAITIKDIKKGWEDKRVLTNLVKDMRRFDRIVGFYITDRKFDLPYLRSRALKYNIDFPAYGELWVTDLHTVVKNKLKFRRNSLRVVCDHFNIPSKSIFTTPQMALARIRGDKKALKDSVAHAKEDVVSTEKLYDILHPYMKLTRTSI